MEQLPTTLSKTEGSSEAFNGTVLNVSPLLVQIITLIKAILVSGACQIPQPAQLSHSACPVMAIVFLICKACGV
jgi:hypothetical protein